MDATRALKKAYDEYRKTLNAQHIRARDIDQERFESHVPLLKRLDAVDSSSVVVYDLFLQRYVFLTSSFRFLLGYPREETLAQGPEYFYQRMHPDDLPVVLETVTRTMKFLLGRPPAERMDYKLSFDFRIRGADERSIRLVQQVVVLELDARGNIWLVMAVNDKAPDLDADSPVERQLLRLKDGKAVLFMAEERNDGAADTETGKAARTAAPRLLSKREIEILGLVGTGMASREIADRLFISVATVNNHRQRILEKTKARNSAEAVRYAMRAGLL